MIRTNRCVLRTLAVLFLLTVLQPALAIERVEKKISLETAIPEGKTVRVENLLGSIRVEGSTEAGKLRIEARVVAEAKTAEEAQALVGSIRLNQDPDAESTGVRVVFPIDRHATLRAPKPDKKSGFLSRWSESLIKRGSTSIDYDGQKVEIGHARAATALAVHLTVYLPFDIASSFHQAVGSIEGRSLRGSLYMQLDHGKVHVNQGYGALEIETVSADARVDFFHGERLRVSTESGKIDLLDVNAKQLLLSSDSGVIGGGKVQAEDMIVENGSGPIRLAGVEPTRFDIRAVTGAIDLATRLVRAEEARIRSDSGDVTLRVGSGTYFDLSALTKSGSIKTLGLQLDPLESDGPGARYKHGRGGVEVQVTAHQGQLTVRPYDASRLDILLGDFEN